MNAAPFYQDDAVTLYLGAAENLYSAVAPRSVSLLVADPPYFRVIDEAFDNQWPSLIAFLGWLDAHFAAWADLLAPNGSLYSFCWPAYAARVECLLADRFDVLNSLVWEKEQSRAEGTCKEDLRSYFPCSERIIFAEQRGADGSALRGSGFAAADAEARAGVFEPLRAYLVAERDAAGITNREVDAFLGTNGMAGHYFGSSQWALPTAEVYASLRELFNRQGGEFLRRQHDDLRRDYAFLQRAHEDLRRDYEGLRRPFNSSKRLPYKDVWHYPPVLSANGKHPAEKPLQMLLDIIAVSSRPGDLVLDPMAGSGTTLVAAKRLGRRAVGFEKDERWCACAAARLAQGVLDFEAVA